MSVCPCDHVSVCLFFVNVHVELEIKKATVYSFYPSEIMDQISYIFGYLHLQVHVFSFIQLSSDT